MEIVNVTGCSGSPVLLHLLEILYNWLPPHTVWCPCISSITLHVVFSFVRKVLWKLFDLIAPTTTLCCLQLAFKTTGSGLEMGKKKKLSLRKYVRRKHSLNTNLYIFFSLTIWKHCLCFKQVIRGHLNAVAERHTYRIVVSINFTLIGILFLLYVTV